jgi:hypothetical protein
MKILYYDCFAGISGDMHLAAMLDIGVDKNYLLGELEKLHLSGVDIDISRERRQGIEGTRVKVRVSDDKEHQVSRSLQDIEAIILRADLSDTVQRRSLEIFHRLAAVEAKVHGKAMHEIHFHETGAIDAIIDIVGAAICIEVLKVDKIFCSPVQLGGGFVECEHGTLPVPAPATIELLENIPIRTGKVEFETTTPTGAAIISSVVDEFGREFELIPEKTGYGIGAGELTIPNVLRVCLGTQREKSSLSDRAMMIECNIDDMNPEFYDHFIDKLLAAGAKDVFITPIFMKKTRPASKLSVLCKACDEASIADILLRETTTLGIRKHEVERTVLERRVSAVKTQYGDVRVKTALFDKKPIKWKPEYEDCVNIAKKNNISLQAVYDEVNSVLLNQKK